ncbi:1,4-beta-D-glucan cellobiohydrolase [Ceratobasidium theobromae]|uniref:Glucanase n=1 Tax=Ceratobasidium theobromae TaxID=1582974 RepID=A0A5N5QAA4_9AGAM|nr:1,4-beta-D-glucan cellobiohydrolase [Ceratobasidium theobromae]
MGDTSFYGKGLTIDTSQKITVVTQFITADGTSTGALSEIRRIYVQNGKVIQNSKANISGMSAYDSITEAFCAAQKTAFNDTNIDYPVGADHSKPGVARGTCATTSGVPADVESQSPNFSVTYSNIRFGDIGSTYGTSTTVSSTASTSMTTSSAAASTSTSTGTAAHVMGPGTPA